MCDLRYNFPWLGLWLVQALPEQLTAHAEEQAVALDQALAVCVAHEESIVYIYVRYDVLSVSLSHKHTHTHTQAHTQAQAHAHANIRTHIYKHSHTHTSNLLPSRCSVTSANSGLSPSGSNLRQSLALKQLIGRTASLYTRL
jgi:hypothetical protein